LILASPFGVPDNRERWNEMKADPGSSKYPRILPVVEKLWNMDVTPQSVIRFIGPWGPRLLESFVDRRFRRLSLQEREAISQYLYHLWAHAGSGEYALGALFHPFGWAKSPLREKLARIQCSTHFLYGEHDWMDWKPADKLLRAGGNTNLKSLTVVPRCGHQLCLENPAQVNALLLDILDN
jgi:cardiolipin-specific phospholipase